MAEAPKIVVQYPWAELPAPGASIEVMPGIHWVRLPLPFVLDHINVFLLEDGDGWTVIDTGLNREEVKDIWQQVFAGVCQGRPISRVIVTHFHPDHMGLGGWFAEHWQTDLWMSTAEWLWSHYAFRAREKEMDAMLDFWRRNGLSRETIDDMRGRGHFYPTNVTRPPVRYRRMIEGDVIEINGLPWQVIVGRGHAPEHICLYCEPLAVLLAGDQVLPRITTNVSVQFHEPDGDPLRLFLASTHLFAHCDPETLVLCSHDRPFRRLHERLAQLREHHEVRLDDAAAACVRPSTPVDLMPVLFKRPLNLHQQSFAIGEAVAHCHRLLYEGRVDRVLGPDGRYRFIRTE